MYTSGSEIHREGVEGSESSDTTLNEEEPAGAMTGLSTSRQAISAIPQPISRSNFSREGSALVDNFVTGWAGKGVRSIV